MFRKRQYIFIKRSKKKYRIVLFVALLAGAGAFFLFPRSEPKVTARMDTSGASPVLNIEVEGPDTLTRFDLPQLSLYRPLTDGRGSIQLPIEDLPPGEKEIVYILRKAWFLPDRRGVLKFERPSMPVNYVVRVEPDGAGGAGVVLSGDPGNHVLLIDSGGRVVLSGPLSDLANAEGIARANFSKAALNNAQAEKGPVTARLSVTSPTGETDEHEVVLRPEPPNAVSARTIFPPPGTASDRPIVRVRILTEPGARVRFGDDPDTYPGPQVEYDWRVSREGKQSLSYEVRADGLRPTRGTVEVERRGRESERSPGTESPVSPEATLTHETLAERPGKYSGRTLEVAGEVMAQPAPMGGAELVEIGSGDDSLEGEIALIYDPQTVPRLRKGDRVIARGRVEGPQRLRTASGWLRTLPKIRADKLEIESRASNPAEFETRYARAFSAFWHLVHETPSPTEGKVPFHQVLGSEDPWPETPLDQEGATVVASEFVSGSGDRVGTALEPSLGAGTLAEEARRPDEVPEDGPAGETGPSPEEAPQEPVGVKPPPEDARASDEPGEHLEPSPELEPDTTLEPVERPSAWGRDRTMEIELEGRGLSGVQIFRRGRSIRLRGTVSDDKELRTLYQFMNDKGFGEVDYGVEIR